MTTDEPHALGGAVSVFRLSRLRRGGVGHALRAPQGGDLLEIAGKGGGEGTWFKFDDAAAKTRHFKLEPVHVEAYRGPIEELCAAPLEVAPVWDSSDLWERLTLDVEWNSRRSRVDLSLMASGFEGPDEERLQRGLEAIHALMNAGLAAGERPTPVQHAAYGFNIGIERLAEWMEANMARAKAWLDAERRRQTSEQN